MKQIEQKTGVGFEQQPGESGKAFAAFMEYLKMGPQRSLAKTAVVVGKSKPQIDRLSQRWNWVARAEAYQAHLAELEREGMEGLVRVKCQDWLAKHEEVRLRAWKQAEDLIALAEDFKERWRESKRLPNFGAVVRALELAFKLKQFAAGMPSEIKEVNTTLTGASGGPIRVELEAALDKIYGKPIPGEVIEVSSEECGVGNEASARQPAYAEASARQWGEL